MTARIPAILVVPLVVLLVICACLGVVTGSSGHDLSVPGAIDTPSQTVTVEGTEYEIDEIASVTPGESLTVDVTTSDDTAFNVDLYNSDEQVEEFESGTGSESVTFDTDDLGPGSYVLALHVDSNHVALHPVVIEGYDVTLESPSTVESDESIDVTVEATPTEATSDPSGVEVAIWDDNTVLREDASPAGDGVYEATFSASDLGVGNYDAYAVVRGSNQVDGEAEVLGVSDGASLEVTEPHDDGAGDGSGDDGGENGPDDGENGTDESDEGDEHGDEDDGSDDDNGQENGTDEGDDSDENGDEGDENGSDGSDDGEAGDDGEAATDEDDEDDAGETDSSDDDDSDESSVQSPSLEENDSDTDVDDSDSIPLVAVWMIGVAALVAGLLARARRNLSDSSHG